MNKIQLLDVIDMETLQKLQDSFARVTGIAVTISDKRGNITETSNPTEFCTELTKNSELGQAMCDECILSGIKEAAEKGEPFIFNCHCGLLEFAVPIIVDGQHIGSVVGGQVLTEQYDEEEIRQIANDIDVDEDEYIEAISKVKTVPIEDVENAVQFLYENLNTLFECEYKSLISIQSENNIKKASTDIVRGIRRMELMVSENFQRVQALDRKFSGLVSLFQRSMDEVEQTDEIIEYNRKVAKQITLLGFNASAESKRVGADGAGFGVIAQEIRRLSNESASQSDNIEGRLRLIRESTKDSVEKFSEISDEVRETLEALKKLNSSVEKINRLVDKIS